MECLIMTIQIIGIVLFFGMHLVPSTSLKPFFISKVGQNKYKTLFSIISLASLGLIIYGFSISDFIPLWNPLPCGKTVAHATMPFAIILLLASNLPNNIKRIVRHPMLIGLILWGSSHLMANGDLASTILFASFSLFAVVNIILVTVGGRHKVKAPTSVRWDIFVVIIGVSLYFLLYYLHGFFTGMPLI
jgi:uncharacterized membrane protein